MTLKEYISGTRILIPCIILVLIAQWVGKGMSPVAEIPGALMMLAIILVSLQIKA